MADYSYQRHAQDHGENSYQPTYPPQALAPAMDRGGNDVPPPYAFGSGYESSRGGGPMRGGPMRGGPMRSEPMRGGPPQRGGFGRGGYPPPGSGGYNRAYQDVDKGPYHEREEWRSGGPTAPPQSFPQRPPQPRPRGSTIVVHDLPPRVTEQDLLDHFGSAGHIKMDPRTRLPEVWLGPQPGEARITFQDSQVAVNAVQWYNNGDFQGSVIHVEMDETMEPPPMPPSMGRMPMRGRGGPGGPGGPLPPHRGDRYPPQRGGYGGMRGGRGDQGRPSFEKRDGDWICANPSCQNTNFKWRSECNRCRAPRPDGDGGDCPPNMNGDFGDGDRFDSRPPFPPGRGGLRGGRGYPPRGVGRPSSMGRGGFGGRGGRGMSDRGRGGFGGRGGPNGNWRQRPY